ncbi:putative serine/threonine protein kinase [Trypanosoma cruzi]|uniref:Serine/threonine protein kinase, putative n=2 Tax=Trypanosoma cruzi TaxID=5693 RepID=Q4CR40_TRYCC|nr:serine/threonine protein kinase, putative [Trypanosoma cruzi]XP_805314.1 serine/threonine protein kinase, putative [Trypanosoma cruzi]EAN82743.1 serine/threonine protein kinase, putative [Trypanosoma cruzi]EAN83463.1 serine/threonine protein kinase, putative [Trypanosoma cruzi]PWV09190.1 putative serine/threonine protein kinase [Trypanosoma cruzi]RNC56329.1 serine/threonine protein kinase [Trypanosoma cruzi]|eukprot:XP_804594.1 serine/threonine protein kinase [Trypanosoma cruzi strain CL Brener]
MCAVSITMGKKYAQLETLHNVNGRVVIVGDIHGCLAQLEDILSVTDFARGRDQLITAGDMVNKGPDSFGVVRLLKSLGARGVIGNHDAKLLKLRKKIRKHGALHGKNSQSSLAPLAMSLPQDVEEYLSQLPHILRIPAHKILVVHAGLHVQHPLERQLVKEVTTMRNLILQDDGLYRASEDTTDGVPWASLWQGPETVVFGHDARRGLQRYPHAIGLDTRCVYGGELTALVCPGEHLVSVPGWTSNRSKV